MIILYFEYRGLNNDGKVWEIFFFEGYLIRKDNLKVNVGKFLFINFEIKFFEMLNLYVKFWLRRVSFSFMKIKRNMLFLDNIVEYGNIDR